MTAYQLAKNSKWRVLAMDPEFSDIWVDEKLVDGRLKCIKANIENENWDILKGIVYY